MVGSPPTNHTNGGVCSAISINEKKPKKSQENHHEGKKQKIRNDHLIRTMNFMYSTAHRVPSQTIAINMNAGSVRLKEKHTTRFTPAVKRR